MLGPERFLFDGQRSHKERLRLRVLPLVVVERCEAVEIDIPSPFNMKESTTDNWMIHSKVPSYPIAILHIFLAILFPQEYFFAQYLTVEQPNAGGKIDQ